MSQLQEMDGRATTTSKILYFAEFGEKLKVTSIKTLSSLKPIQGLENYLAWSSWKNSYGLCNERRAGHTRLRI